MIGYQRIKSVCDRLEYECVRTAARLQGSIKGNAVTVYWYRDILNFGDLITPLLLQHFGYTPIFSRPKHADLVATGSILEHLSPDYSGVIFGSGFIEATSRSEFPNAKILAVRGMLTRERLGQRHNKALLGDPGLLASCVIPARQSKKYVLGIIPHHADKDAASVANLKSAHPSQMLVIDVQQSPQKVFAAIDSCEHILSSSLHGLIVADSLDISNGWVASSNLLGGRFKFDDYYSAIGTHAEPVTLSGNETVSQLVRLTSRKPNGRIVEVKHSLQQLWSSLPSYL